MQPLVAYLCSWVAAETLCSKPAFPSLWVEPPRASVMGLSPRLNLVTDSTLGLLGSPAMSFLQMGPKGSTPIPSRDLFTTCSPGQGNVGTAGEVKSPLWGLDPFLPLPYPHLESKKMSWGV